MEPLKEEELHDTEPIEKADQVLNDYWTRENITVDSIPSIFIRFALPISATNSSLLYSLLPKARHKDMKYYAVDYNGNLRWIS